MRTKMLFSVMLSASVAMVSCKGDKGELGPKGDTGAQGTAGVKYSNWIRVTDANWVETSRDLQTTGPKDSLIKYFTEIPTPEVTQDILDKGVVAYYIKDATAFGKGTVRNLDLQLMQENSAPLEVGTTNRTAAQNTGNLGSFSRYVVSTPIDTIPKGKLTLNTTWFSSEAFYTNSYWMQFQPLKQKFSELKPKTDLYVRYVVIPAGTLAGGRMAPVDMKNYEAVKAYYHIKD